MRGGWVWLWLRRVLVGVVCVVAAVGTGWVLYAGFRYWQVERAIGQFDAGPSQGQANVLAGLIDNGVPTAKQGERALELLLTPELIKRRAYALGSCPVIGVELPFAVPFRHVTIARREQFVRNGKLQRCTEGSGRNIDKDMRRRWILDPAPERIGAEFVELRQRYRLRLDHLEARWSWHPFSGPFPQSLLPTKRTRGWRSKPLKQWDYACSVAAQTEVVIAESSEVETVALKTNPGLDEAMWAAFDGTAAAFERVPQPMRSASANHMSGGWLCLHLVYRDLPVAVAFEPLLRLPDGREFPSMGHIGQRLVARTGSSGQLTVPFMIMTGKPGSDAGAVVLRADPNAAHGDPGIEAIWDGTLEIPISYDSSGSLFTISPGDAGRE